MTGEGDFRIAMPDGGFAFKNAIDWLAKWDRIMTHLRHLPPAEVG